MKTNPRFWSLKTPLALQPLSVAARGTPSTRLVEPLQGGIDHGQPGHDPLEVEGRELPITSPLQRRAVQLVEVASLGSGHQQTLDPQK